MTKLGLSDELAIRHRGYGLRVLDGRFIVYAVYDDQVEGAGRFFFIKSVSKSTT
jgi:hypothetical protein